MLIISKMMALIIRRMLTLIISRMFTKPVEYSRLLLAGCLLNQWYLYFDY